MKRPVQAKELWGKKSCPIRQKRDVDRTEVGKRMDFVPGKAAIAYPSPVP